MRSFISSEILGVGHYVPEKIITNHDLSKIMDTSDTWIKERTGIEERRIADTGVSTSDLGYKASLNLFQETACSPHDIDLIIAATLSPDYYFPGIGVLIQRKLELTCPAMDLRAQCSGFSWGITTAHAMLQSNQYKNILVVGADLHSRVIEFSNRGRNVSVLFGDGAGAVLISANNVAEKPTAQNNISGIIDNTMGSDGTGAEVLAMLRPGMSGSESFFTPKEAEEKAYLPYMEGRKVFKNAVVRMCESLTTLLQRNDLQTSDIDLLIPHQANTRIIDTVGEKMGFSKDKLVSNISKYGNTTSASLPLCMKDAIKEGRLKKGNLIMTVVFGSGFTWGANLIRW